MVLFTCHLFAKAKKMSGQKRDQWMLEAQLGEIINGSEMFCILIVAVVP